jgi:UDP-N-acetylmuramoylalanine--D-glutamate ligase
MDDLKSKRVTVLGLGRFGGGIAVARWLCQRGAKVLVTDREDATSLADSIKQLDGLPIEYRLGADQQRLGDFTDVDLVVTSPAVKPKSEFLQAAREKGVTITTEICLFAERCPGRVIGGNIGRSLLFDLPNMNEQTQVVLELSSYMLHYLGERAWSPRVAVVTMLGQDHLDWHGSVDSYIDAKRNIVRYQRAGDLLVRRNDATSLTFAANAGVTTKTYPDPAIPRFELLLPGEHNQQNAQAAYLASGLPFDAAQAAVRGFKGIEHRLQLVYESNGVRFFNDSIATIPEAAIIACDAFQAGTVIQIVGGALKEGLSWDAMCAHLSSRCKRVLTIGQIGRDLAGKCDNAEYVETLDAAVARARSIATAGDVVLLSPGTASYDQFPNFEFRGRRFAELARG